MTAVDDDFRTIDCATTSAQACCMLFYSQVGNQQWAFRNISVTGSKTACIHVPWNWVYVFQGLRLSNCPIGVWCICVVMGRTRILLRYSAACSTCAALSCLRIGVITIRKTRLQVML